MVLRAGGSDMATSSMLSLAGKVICLFFVASMSLHLLNMAHFGAFSKIVYCCSRWVDTCVCVSLHNCKSACGESLELSRRWCWLTHPCVIQVRNDILHFFHVHEPYAGEFDL